MSPRQQDVCHPGTAAVDHLRHIGFDGLIYLIGTTALRDYLTESGFRVCTGSWAPIDESVAALWQSIRQPPATEATTAERVGAVIIDWDFNLTMKQLHRAEWLLRNDAACLFIACATDMFLGFAVPIMGPGPFYRALEQATGRRALVLGKPGGELRDVVLRKYEIRDPKRVLFVGDMLEQDVGFGRVCGFQTLVVLTGAVDEEQVQRHRVPAEVPDFVLPGFGDLAAVCEGLKVTAGGGETSSGE